MKKMANSTVGECILSFAVKSWFSVAIAGTFLLFVLSLQLFIMAVNIIDCIKGRALTAVDLIITIIATTRVISFFSNPLHLFAYYCPSEFGAKLAVANLVTGISAGFSSIWLSTLLSVLFCFMISTFNNVFFLHMKTFISQRVVYLIITSVLMGFGYAFMFLLYIYYAMKKNLPYIEVLLDRNHFPITFFFNCLWNIFPSLMFFMCSVLLVVCLSLHIRQLKIHKNVISSTDTYHKMIIFTVVSFLSCAFGGIINITERYSIKFFGIVWMNVFWNTFPLLHSLSLIYATTKLRMKFFKIVHWGMNCVRKPSEPDTGEPMEVTRL